MTIESVIISFIVVCSSLIAANILLLPFRQVQDSSLNRKTAEMKRRFHAIADGLSCEETAQDKAKKSEYQKWLRKKLQTPLWLIAFDQSLQALQQERDGGLDLRYINLIMPCFESLCSVYEKKDSVSLTFFINVLGKLLRYKPDVSLRIWEFLYVRLRSPSIECRQQVMDALYATGDIVMLIRGLSYLNKYHSEYNDKLITDGLTKFNGDKELLCDRLWQLYPKLNNSFKLAVINFLRLESPLYRQEALAILQDAQADAELHYAAIRYLGKYPLPEAEKLLQQYVSDCSHDTWVYAAVSAAALSAYPGKASFEVLKKALFSPEWYVRLNASDSLGKMGISYRSLSDVMSSSDRYAREIVQYRLEQQQTPLETNEA